MYSTLRVDSVAEIVVFPINKQGIKEIYTKYLDKTKILIGKGSNILLSREYYGSEYVFVCCEWLNLVSTTKNRIYCEAGASLSSISWFALEQNLCGYEFLEDIPGSLGGAIVMNAGTYNDNIGQLIDSIEYYDIEKGQILKEEASTNDFGRRTSKWSGSNFIILSAELKINSNMRENNYEDILAKMLEIKKQRYLKQPRNYPNAGSVFKRPTLNGKDYYVWALFEELGLRGLRIGDAMISDKHPGFIVNVGDAKAKDILSLINIAKEKVKEKFDIDLELEWEVI